jgi:putative ABC transport system permease protein
VTLASSLLFGVAPAWQLSRVDLTATLRDGGRTSAGSRSRLGDLFVAGEVALSLVLLIGSGLLLKSLWNLQHVDLGFQPAHVLTLDFGLNDVKYHDVLVRTRFLEGALASARSLPEVQSAGLAGGLPLASKGGLRQEFTPEGWRSEQPAIGVYRVISPGFLETLKVPLIRGRFFHDHDGEAAPLVVLINQTAARTFWPGRDPIGKRLKLGNEDAATPWLEVVGVTGDIQEVGLDMPPRLEVYCAHRQSQSSWQWPRFLVLRTAGDPLSVRQALAEQVARIDPEEPLEHVMPLVDIVGREMTQTRSQGILLSALAALAVTMACVGIYGVLAHLVTQRTREIGIRTALGAKPRDIAGLVLRYGARLMLVGIASGLIAAVGLSRLMQSLLFGVSPIDPLMFAALPAVLTLIALIACYLPVRRAARIDPTIALRRD